MLGAPLDNLVLFLMKQAANERGFPWQRYSACT
jgi:hypothetical protein